ncbi:MAG: hypothetical protein J7501_07840 [Bdellovibrio sp.]|nr:hypothetical protein [Bdellovibrio sp.]
MKHAFLTAFFCFFLASNCYAQFYGFNKVDQSLKATDQIEITNMPPLMSQDSVANCYAFPAANLLNAEVCRYEKIKCSELPQDQMFSPLGLARYGRPEETKESANLNAKNKNADALQGPDGGNSFNILNYVTRYLSAPSEKCMSLDRILSKVGGADQVNEMQVHAFQRLEQMYSKSKKIKSDCADCLSNFYASAQDEIEKNFDVKVSSDRLLKMFAQSTYTEFFDRLFTPSECYRAKNSAFLESKVEPDSYPPEGIENGNYAGAIEQIKDTLTSGRPLALGNICGDKEPKPKDKKTKKPQCKAFHEVTVAGYRKVCDKKNKCRDVVKVINSWGKSWQEQNDEGWLDAKSLLDRTFYEEGTLTWLKDKAQE